MIEQLIVNGLIAAGIYGLAGLGFGLIFWVSKFFHFAYGIIFTAGAYFTFLILTWLSFPLLPAILLATGLSAVMGCCIEVFIYRPIRCKGATSLVLLLASLGVYIVIQNLISITFGDDVKVIRPGNVREGVNIFGVRITTIQMSIVCISTILIVVVAILLRTTKIGKAMRAVANDPELADVSGIVSNRIILYSVALGSALAGVAGILLALDVDMNPTMGMNALMMGVVVVIIGGEGSVLGVSLGAVLLGLAQHLGVWKVSSQWQDAIAFIILLAFLLLRPQGFLGKKVRKATV